MTLTARPEVVVGASTLLTDAGATEAVGVLSAHGVETILLKGPSIARAKYGHGGEPAAYRDVDLLVEPSRLLEDAGHIVTRLGYAPIDEPVLDADGHHAGPGSAGNPARTEARPAVSDASGVERVLVRLLLSPVRDQLSAEDLKGNLQTFEKG